MSHYEVTGWLQHEVAERRSDFRETHSDDDKQFDETFCLAKIPNQPEEYDGPPRYCMSTETNRLKGSDSWLCHHHGGHGGDPGDKGERHPENLVDIHMKSGMQATVENLKDDFDDKDEKLYEWIVESYPQKYDIDLEANPGLVYDLHRLAIEIVRAERGRGYLLEEGEVQEQELTDEDGCIVTDPNTGEVVTQKSKHYLAEMMARQDSKITKLEKELGITRKEQERRDQTDDAIAEMKNFTEIGAAFIDRDSNDYDPDEKPWEEDE